MGIRLVRLCGRSFLGVSFARGPDFKTDYTGMVENGEVPVSGS